MGWFIGMAFLPLLYKHSDYLSEHNWLPYIVLSAFAIAGGILILCMQKVCVIFSVDLILTVADNCVPIVMRHGRERFMLWLMETTEIRFVLRCMGSGIKGVGSGIRRVGSGMTT